MRKTYYAAIVMLLTICTFNNAVAQNNNYSENYIQISSPDFVNVSPKNFLRTKERYVDGVS